MKPDERAVLEALKSVDFGDGSRDLVESGQVSGIVVKDGNVGFSLEIDPADAGGAGPLKDAAEAAVLGIKGVVSATAMLTSHRATSPGPGPEAAGQQRQPPAMHKPAKHIIAVASGKGGVGKSTTAVNLALALKGLGRDTAILDADIYGPSLPRLLGTSERPKTSDKRIVPIEAHGLKAMSIGFLLEEDSPTIWRGPMVMSALEQMLRDVDWGGPEILVIDMPPGTGDAQLTLSQRTSLAGAVIVSTPQDLALIDARKGLNMFRKVNVPVLGIVENMSHFICPSCGTETPIFGHGGAEAEAARLGVPFLGHVPLEMEIRTSSDAGKPVVASQPDGRHAEIYTGIAARLLEALPDSPPEGPSITIN